MLKTIRVKTPYALSTSCTVVSPDTFWTNVVNTLHERDDDDGDDDDDDDDDDNNNNNNNNKCLKDFHVLLSKTYSIRAFIFKSDIPLRFA